MMRKQNCEISRNSYRFAVLVILTNDRRCAVFTGVYMPIVHDHVWRALLTVIRQETGILRGNGSQVTPEHL